MNKVLVIGRVVRDVETLVRQRGGEEFKVINNAVALNRVYHNAQGERVEEVTFADFVIMGSKADTFGKYVKKGHSVQLEGRLFQNTYETKTGEKRSRLEIRVEEFGLLNNNPLPNGAKPTVPATKAAAPKKAAPKKEAFESTYEDEYAGETIPF